MKAFFYIIKTRILLSLTYRFNLISILIVQFIIILVNKYFWIGAYKNKDIINNITLNDMLVYSCISVIISCFFMQSAEKNLRQKIRDGSVAMDYIKPMNIFGMYFAEDVGNIVVSITQKVIPIAIFSCIFVIVPIPASILHLFLFLLSCTFSFIIIWLIGAIFGLLNFWVIDLGPIGFVKDGIVRFLSGSIIPIWFFPQAIQGVMYWLPFVYIYQTPISIFMGKVSINNAITSIMIQIAWLIIFYFLFRIIESKAYKNLLVQGG